MKRIRIASLSALLALLCAPLYAQGGTVVVTVAQLDVAKGGTLKIGIYDEEGFPDVGKELHGIGIAIEDSSMTYVFESIPIGTYAIAVFQDKNNDGKLNTNLVGVPKEPYGFSQNSYGKFGAPAFKNVSFEVEEDASVSLTINVK
jgi:uncharacterized protein (DUF2141 family)